MIIFRYFHIQTVTLNGQPLRKPWFTYADIADGGKLGSTPNIT